MPSSEMVTNWMRNYAASGILKNIVGILVGRPQSDDMDYINGQYKSILKVVRDEEKLDIPILVNCDFGHTDPQMIMPYGSMVEINTQKQNFSILESGVS